MTPSAGQFVARLEAWTRARDDIRLVLLLGSQARSDDPADEFSDVDVVLSCRDQRRYLDNPDWLAEIGTPLLTCREPTATGGEFERRVLFATGLDVDVTLIAHATARAWAADGLPPDVLPVFRRGARVVIDKDGLGPRLAAQAEANVPAPARPDAEELVEKIHDFLYHCLWAARKAARGELFVALQSVNCYLRRRLFEVVQIHHDLVLGEPTAWYGARMIELRTGADTVARLAATCATYDRQSIHRAIDAAIELHASLAKEMCKRLGAAYPTDAEARLRAMIAETRR